MVSDTVFSLEHYGTYISQKVGFCFFVGFIGELIGWLVGWDF